MRNSCNRLPVSDCPIIHGGPVPNIFPAVQSAIAELAVELPEEMASGKPPISYIHIPL